MVDCKSLCMFVFILADDITNVSAYVHGRQTYSFTNGKSDDVTNGKANDYSHVYCGQSNAFAFNKSIGVTDDIETYLCSW